mgnify:CR=1 FL=1
MGLTEFDFWRMTIAELNRAIASRVRVRKTELQERAYFDYVLAQLVTKGVNIALTGRGDLPALADVYSNLLDDETKAQKEKAVDQKKMELSSLRFKLFAQSYNKRFKEAAKDKQ